MKKLGEILLERDLVTPDQLENALRRQSMSGGRLGEHLVEMLILDEDQVCKMLGIQFGVPAAMPADLDNIPDDVVRIFPGELVQTYHVVPFKLQGKRLHVAMLEPDSIEIIDKIAHQTGCIVRSYISMESVIHRAMAKFFQITARSTFRPEASVTASLMDDIIIRDNQFDMEDDVSQPKENLLALDDSGQFTFVDRVNILGDHTKSLFLDAQTPQEIVKYLLQLVEQLCDRVVFLIVDGNNNYFWNELKEYRSGNKGKPLGETIYKSHFWKRYLESPDIKFVSLEPDSAEMLWAPKMLKMNKVNAFVLIPLHLSPGITGIAMGGAKSAFTLMEEIETFKKLQVMADCSLTILRCKRTIQESE
jgi:hypothetical protein